MDQYARLIEATGPKGMEWGSPIRSSVLALCSLLAALSLPACRGSSNAGSPDAGPTCAPEPATAVSAQTRARLGAYFFDGWSGPLANFHFKNMVGGPYADRQPLTGWLDSSPCVIEEQLATARAFGIDFFVFDWYFGVPRTSNGEALNSALQITRALPERHGMQYAILYVNSDVFIVQPADWPQAVNEWVSYFQDPAYLRIDGKPALFIIDSEGMRATFGASAQVASALGTLRGAAKAKGLAGVYVVGGFVPPYLGDTRLFERRVIGTFAADGYDAISMYNYPGTPTSAAVNLPFASLVGAGHWIWQEAAAYSPLPFIPVAMSGWDSRPWNGTTTVWYTRSPAEVGAFVGDAVDFAESTPALRAEPSPTPPLVLIEAWNELGEGSFFIPTVGDQRTVGDAIATALAAAPPRARSVLSVDDTGPSSASRQASGTLTDAAGAPVAGATVAITAAAVDGAGLYAQHTLADVVPQGAVQAVVGFRVNTEFEPPSTGGGAASSFALYQVSFQQADGAERVVNGDFSAGVASWSFGDQAQLVTSDRGPGQMVLVQATSTQKAELTSAAFAVAAGGTFRLAMSARVAPSSAGSGYFTVIFLNGFRTEFMRLWIPLAAGRASIGSATTDASGAYHVSLSNLGAAQTTVVAEFAGDARRYPAHVSVTK